jgi:hypothetical protein
MTEPTTDAAPVAFEKHVVDQVSDVVHPSTATALVDPMPVSSSRRARNGRTRGGGSSATGSR